ncbi:hypothetical protein KIN20_005484 [Parelaphostrongylus tenuis]|uniref:Uncharacterized protein n=1 Tax=Parelaphostrongylus tenuis TaxID=148309 RepID=A0AAD5MLB0_PARTN|nr:hypothetical protein KIN20_005484 [Parelaphostrongylus tenuis]
MMEESRTQMHEKYSPKTENLTINIRANIQQTTTTILQNTGHHYPPLFAIGPPGFGSDRSTTPSALNQ